MHYKTTCGLHIYVIVSRICLEVDVFCNAIRFWIVFLVRFALFCFPQTMFYGLFVVVFISWILQGCFAPVFIKRMGNRVAKTDLGLYRGVTIDFPADTGLRSIEGFLGIQFARGRMRFMPPMSGRKWTHIKGVQNFSAACPQNQRRIYDAITQKAVAEHVTTRTSYQQEDCLTLNIYTPCSVRCPASYPGKLTHTCPLTVLNS